MVISLLRHAKAEKRQQDNLDFERALSPLGQQQVLSLSERLVNLWPISKAPNLQIWCSPSRRTRDTMNLLFNSQWNESIHIELERHPLKIEYPNWLYLADGKHILQKIRQSNHVGQLLIIGHNDGLSDLANHLTNRADLHLKTCSLIVMEKSSVNRERYSILKHWNP